MSVLENFSEEEILMLTSLAYRTGMWMSNIDDEEGEHDDIQEVDALHKIIKTMTKETVGTDITQEIAKRVISEKEKWPEWDEMIFNVVEQSRTAVDLIEQKLGKEKAKDYRMMLLKIARQVAKAADEFDDFNPETDKATGFGGMIEKLTKKVVPGANKDPSHQANISPAEQGAFNELIKATEIEEE